MTTIATTGHERGTAEYRRLGAALWFGGIATFVLVYAVQGLLPTLADEFAISSSTSSLALSATTGTLALAIVPLASVAESWGRARVMTWALACRPGWRCSRRCRRRSACSSGSARCRASRWPPCPRC